ncbi:response regulator transcription factor [Micromonospora sp. HK10]|uniref:response regulator transcription factor n=1 Tax=Micromonospora sp. HK10 TaxID=1538294 RepID=UPI0006270F1A|nr:response regulator transcription factor [Micromonospora sp. HK10]KKK07782.1 hypothetical protein LQ51_00685 [Micromonospora sp. HK10]
MIRTLLALKGRLVREALAQLLAAEGDIDIIGGAATAHALRDALRDDRPDVAVVDADLVPLHQLARITAARPAGGGRLLILVEQRRAARVGPVLAEHGRRVGFLSRDVPPQRIAEGVRLLADGQLVLDPELVVAALEVAESPLTHRERDVLDVAAEGHPVREIAEKLAVSPGTVRNHLSRIMAKCGARTRLEAVRIARESGWI